VPGVMFHQDGSTHDGAPGKHWGLTPEGLPSDPIAQARANVRRQA